MACYFKGSPCQYGFRNEWPNDFSQAHLNDLRGNPVHTVDVVDGDRELIIEAQLTNAEGGLNFVKGSLEMVKDVAMDYMYDEGGVIVATVFKQELGYMTVVGNGGECLVRCAKRYLFFVSVTHVVVQMIVRKTLDPKELDSRIFGGCVGRAVGYGVEKGVEYGASKIGIKLAAGTAGAIAFWGLVGIELSHLVFNDLCGGAIGIAAYEDHFRDRREYHMRRRNHVRAAGYYLLEIFFRLGKHAARIINNICPSAATQRYLDSARLPGYNPTAGAADRGFPGAVFTGVNGDEVYSDHGNTNLLRVKTLYEFLRKRRFVTSLLSPFNLQSNLKNEFTGNRFLRSRIQVDTIINEAVPDEYDRPNIVRPDSVSVSNFYRGISLLCSTNDDFGRIQAAENRFKWVFERTCSIEVRKYCRFMQLVCMFLRDDDSMVQQYCSTICHANLLNVRQVIGTLDDPPVNFVDLQDFHNRRKNLVVHFFRTIVEDSQKWVGGLSWDRLFERYYHMVLALHDMRSFVVVYRPETTSEFETWYEDDVQQVRNRAWELLMTNNSGRKVNLWYSRLERENASVAQFESMVGTTSNFFKASNDRLQDLCLTLVQKSLDCVCEYDFGLCLKKNIFGDSVTFPDSEVVDIRQETSPSSLRFDSTNSLIFSVEDQFRSPDGNSISFWVCFGFSNTIDPTDNLKEGVQFCTIGDDLSLELLQVEESGVQYCKFRVLYHKNGTGGGRSDQRWLYVRELNVIRKNDMGWVFISLSVRDNFLRIMINNSHVNARDTDVFYSCDGQSIGRILFHCECPGLVGYLGWLSVHNSVLSDYNKKFLFGLKKGSFSRGGLVCGGVDVKAVVVENFTLQERCLSLVNKLLSDD